MKRQIATLFLAFATLLLSAQTITVRDRLVQMHEEFGVNFVYDSSINLGQACTDNIQEGRHSLEEHLRMTFDGTDIKWEIKKRYVVLSRQGKKSGYTILVRSQRDTLEESRIIARASETEARTSTGFKKLDSGALDKGYAFMSSPDLIKTLQTLPGVASGVELLSGLYVHGGDGSDNLFLLDGTPIYQSGHLGGLFSAFNHDIVNEVDFYKSGFPARYGGRLSSVVDARTRAGDMYEYHGSMSIGLIDGKIQFEGPLKQGKTSFNVAMRRSWLDAATLPVFSIINAGKKDKRHDFRYAFHDFNAGITHRFAEDNILEFKTYYGKDNLRIGYMVREFVEDINSMDNSSADMDIDWGNFLSTLIWKKRLGHDITMNAAIYHTRGNIHMDVINSHRGWDDPILATYSESYTSITATSAAKADFTYKGIKGLTLDFGASYQHHEYAPNRDLTNTSWRYDGSINRTSISEKAYLNGHETAAYADGYLRISDLFRAHAGLRYVFFAVKGKTMHKLEPRLSIRFDIGGHSRIDMSYTEMNQFAHQLSTSYLDLPTEFWMPSTRQVDPMFSRQVAAEYSLKLPCGFRLATGLYWKTLDNLTEQWNGNMFVPPVTNWDQSIITGKGRAYGLEIETEYTNRKLSLSAYYTLAWSERRFEELWYDWYPDIYDNRHKINLMATFRFSERFDIYAGWHYHSGNRTTTYGYIHTGYDEPIHVYGSPNNMRLPDYHRLDLGLNFRKTTRKGNQSIWNISIYNAYCRMNALFAEMLIYTDSYRCTTYGIVPIIPSFSYTLKF